MQKHYAKSMKNRNALVLYILMVGYRVIRKLQYKQHNTCVFIRVVDIHSIWNNTGLILKRILVLLTCKACFQLLTLVGNNVVIWWHKGAAWTVQADLETTVSVCGERKVTTRGCNQTTHGANHEECDGGGTCAHLCGSSIHSLPPSHRRRATRPPSVFVPPCCLYIAASGTSGLCVLKSV